MARRNSLFIVVGRLGPNLVVSKALPAISSRIFDRVIIFSENQGLPVIGAEYITLPAFIRKMKPVLARKLFRIIYEPLQLTFYAWRYRPAVIHGYYSLPKGLNGLIAAKLSGSRCIISIIGSKEEIERSFFIKRYSRRFIMWYLRKADHLTTKGRKDNEYLSNYGFDEARISIFNGAIDTNRFCYEEEEKDIDILFAGYFDEFKGPQRALEILAKVKSVKPGIRSVFIGQGPLFESMVEKAASLGLSGTITFAGQVNDAENYFKRSGILLFPSSNEGLSTAMLEAMACGCIPVTSDVGNQTEAAKNEYNSLVIPDYHDMDAFAGNIIRLLENKELMKTLSDNAQKTIHAKYTPEEQGKICKLFYSQLMQTYN